MIGFTNHVDNLFETNLELSIKLQNVKNEIQMLK
jgi:hypothetical protein